MKNSTTDSLTLGIVGAGVMGRGIAQIAAAAGFEVLLFDRDQTEAENGRDYVLTMLDRAMEKGRMSAADANNAGARIRCVSDLGQFRPADLIVEAIIEKLEIKQSLFAELEQVVGAHCILASNTSSLPITAISNACMRPERVVGFHFFNPVPLMKLAEIIAGFRTAPAVIHWVSALTRRMGHTPVSVVDSPGFLVNHAGRGLNTEGLRILQEQVAGPATVDAIMREAVGLRMGPFELMDLTGLDVTYPVTGEIYEGFYQEPRLRPTPGLRRRFMAGVWGKKTGRGFYQYTDGQRLSVEEISAPNVSLSSTFWISQLQPSLSSRVAEILAATGAQLDAGPHPADNSIAIVTPLGLDATSACLEQNLNPALTIAVDALFCSKDRITLMTTPQTSAQTCAHARVAFASSGKAVSVIRDSAGLVAPRIVATIVNTAAEIAQQGIASPQEIDIAVRLGLGYPVGPLAMGDELGPNNIVKILEEMQATYGDPRYRPSPWLRRRAQLGLSLLHLEQRSNAEPKGETPL